MLLACLVTSCEQEHLSVLWGHDLGSGFVILLIIIRETTWISETDVNYSCGVSSCISIHLMLVSDHLEHTITTFI